MISSVINFSELLSIILNGHMEFRTLHLMRTPTKYRGCCGICETPIVCKLNTRKASLSSSARHQRQLKRDRQGQGGTLVSSLDKLTATPPMGSKFPNQNF